MAKDTARTSRSGPSLRAVARRVLGGSGASSSAAPGESAARANGQRADAAKGSPKKSAKKAGTPTKPTAVKKQGAGTANKPGAKKAAAKKTAAKKTAGKTTTAKQATAKRTGAKKTAANKTAANKTAVKKTAAKKTAAKKTTAKKTTANKTAANKTAANKTAANKTTAKKTTAKKTTGARERDGKSPQQGPERRARKTAGTPRRRKGVVLAVLPGEREWTATEVNEVRGELDAERDRLLAEISSAEDDMASLLRDGGEGAGNDQADVGSNALERDSEMSLANNTRDMLYQVDRAKARLEDGSYGVCESCGNPIGKARLMAFPRATLCLSCKQRQERR